MFWAPEDSVTVMFAAPRSNITVSFAPGRRGVGSVCVPIGDNCPGPGTGAVGVCPLFQFASVDQSPLELFIHNAGISKSFKYSIPPCATSTSQLLAPPPIAFTCAVLAYCQNFHGCVGFGASSHGP